MKVLMHGRIGKPEGLIDEIEKEKNALKSLQHTGYREKMYDSMVVMFKELLKRNAKRISSSIRFRRSSIDRKRCRVSVSGEHTSFSCSGLNRFLWMAPGCLRLTYLSPFLWKRLITA